MTQRVATEAPALAPPRDWEEWYHLMIEGTRDEAMVQALSARLDQWVAAHTTELREANMRLQEINASKDELLSVVAHDLRAPLGFIQNATEVLKEDPDLPMRALSLIARIGQAANQTLDLLIKLLDLSRLQIGSIELDASPVLVSSVARQALEVLQHAAEAKGLVIELTVALDETSVMADEIRLYQIITNLLSNAIKFTHCGGRIAIEVAPEATGMYLRVADTGIGIPSEYLPYLFEQYRQIHRNGTADEHGSGLGLAIVRQLVELHGGTVEVTSIAGQGSSFTVHLPRGQRPG